MFQTTALVPLFRICIFFIFKICFDFRISCFEFSLVCLDAFLIIFYLNFEFVSNFDIRASNFIPWP
jgi:hypothetical protein